MKDMLIKMALPMVLHIMEEMITKENLDKYGGKLFDLLEEFIADSDTKIDDEFILPLVKAARIALGIN